MTTQETPLPTAEHFIEVAAEHASEVARGFTDELHPIRDEVLHNHGQGNPDSYLRLLADDQVQATFRQRRTAVIARELVVEPGGPSELDALAADHLRAQLDALPFDRICWRALTCIICGYGVAETIFDVDEQAKVVIKAVKVRKAGRFRFGKDGHTYIIDPVRKRLPERKFWTFAWGAETDDDPHGLGLGHTLYWLVWFKRNAIKFWAQFLELYSQPIPIASVPPGTKKEDMNAVLRMLGAFAVSGKLVIPNNVKIALEQAAKDSGGDYDRFCIRLDAAISKVIVLQTMTTDDGSSLAQGAVHERVADVGSKADSDLLTESFEQGPATWVTQWNFPGAKTPTIYRDFSEPDDLAKVAELDTKLSTLGYRPTAERIARVYGDGYELAPAPAMPQAFAEGLARRALFAEKPLPDIATAVDEMLEGDKWREIMGPEIEAIESLLAEGKTLEEVRDRLGELVARDPKPLVDALSKAMFAGAVAGNAGAEEP